MQKHAITNGHSCLVSIPFSLFLGLSVLAISLFLGLSALPFSLFLGLSALAIYLCRLSLALIAIYLFLLLTPLAILFCCLKPFVGCQLNLAERGHCWNLFFFCWRREDLLLHLYLLVGAVSQTYTQSIAKQE